MKYGKIINNHVCLFIETDNNKNWKSGNIYYKTTIFINNYNKPEKGTVKLTASEIITKYSLKRIIVPDDCDTTYSHYNYIETDTTITLTDYTDDYKAELTKRSLETELSNLEKALDHSAATIQNYILETECGQEHHHTREYIDNLRVTHISNCHRCTEIKTLLNIE